MSPCQKVQPFVLRCTMCWLRSIEWMLWAGRHLCFCCDRRIAIHQAILTDAPDGVGSVGAAGKEDLAARL